MCVRIVLFFLNFFYFNELLLIVNGTIPISLFLFLYVCCVVGRWSGCSLIFHSFKILNEFLMHSTIRFSGSEFVCPVFQIHQMCVYLSFSVLFLSLVFFLVILLYNIRYTLHDVRAGLSFTIVFFCTIVIFFAERLFSVSLVRLFSSFWSELLRYCATVWISGLKCSMDKKRIYLRKIAQ